MYARYIVEIRGLSFVAAGTTEYGQDEPLENGPVGGVEVLRLDVGAGSPKAALERARESLQKLLQDDLDGEIARDRGPGSY